MSKKKEQADISESTENCKHHVECDVEGRLDGEFDDEEDANEAAFQHEKKNPGHHTTIKTECDG